MKKIITLLTITSALLLAVNVFAGTLKLQPYGAQGESAQVWSVQPNQNGGFNDHFTMNGWTWQGTPGIERTLVNFNWGLIPANVTITSATLSLYGNVGPGTEFHWPLSGSNASYIQRIKSSWSAATVTWNTQPTSDNIHQVTLPQTVGKYDDYLNINVTALVQDIYNNPGSHYGFLFLLQNENYYRRMCFKSCYQPDTSRFPTLTINYVTSGNCITLSPYGSQGEDAEIWTLQPDSNKSGYPRIAMNAWTWSGPPGIERSLMNFNWNLIPANASVVSASLSLFGNIGSTENHQTLSGSNAFYIQRITSPWNAHTVTWNNQPSTDTVHQVLLPQSVGQYDDYLNIDVTAMVQDINNNPTSYYGFKFLLQNENYYRRMMFKSADQTDTSRFPKLMICYSLSATNPPASNFQSSGNSFCSEGTACVDFFDHSAGNPASWHWLFPGASPSSSNQQNPSGICYFQPGTYAVTLITTNSNGSDTLVVSPMITIGLRPVVPTITLHTDTLMSSRAYSYQWFLNGVPIFGATDSFYIAKQPGSYDVQIFDSLGCSALGVAVTYNSISELYDGLGMGIYPNPATDQLFINCSMLSGSGTIKVYNVLGEKIFEMNSKLNFPIEINTRNFSSGIYFVHLNTVDKEFIQKVIIR